MEQLEREKPYLYWLCRIPQLGAVSIRRIYETFGSFEKAYNIEGTELLHQGIFRRRQQAESYDRQKADFPEALEEWQGLSDRGISFLTPWDEAYPPLLKHIYDYPMGLWAKGKLPDSQASSVAVIGSRSGTPYGLQAAEYLARELSKEGVQIVSGLASGIDSAGHRGALQGRGGTWAVLGCGVNICYPKYNYPLYERILENGGLLSEYPPDVPPLPRNFPMRNRIISGLSEAILVIEARAKSGSLITAQLGLDQGREIFALPGRITDPVSLGCNQLLKNGAATLTEPGDVLEYLGIIREKRMVVYEKNEKRLAKSEKMVYSFLDSAPKHIEEIAAAVGLSVSDCFGALTELELGGLAVRTTGQYYVRRIN